MQVFQCPNCKNNIFFNNGFCGNCGRQVGFSPDDNKFAAYDQSAQAWYTSASEPSQIYFPCQNANNQACNWLIKGPADEVLCAACRLNKTIPDISIDYNLNAWQVIERAKHHLVYGLLRLKLPVMSLNDSPENGLCFHFLTPEAAPDHQVVTGHYLGEITINLAETDSAYREKLRKQFAEPYRTLIGHLRHEVGHYYWELLISKNNRNLQKFRQLFGDERLDYQQALTSFYDAKNAGNLVSQPENFISDYASSHPWEDWAETWAHYLHIVDLVDTANAFGVSLNTPVSPGNDSKTVSALNAYGETDFDRIAEVGFPVALCVNSINRSMGQPDLYPFIVTGQVKEKLAFIHNLIKQQL